MTISKNTNCSRSLHIYEGDIIRFRKGGSALMRMEKHDDLCGFKMYYGTHLYGEQISVKAEGCTKATKEELRNWLRHKSNREDGYC